MKSQFTSRNFIGKKSENLCECIKPIRLLFIDTWTKAVKNRLSKFNEALNSIGKVKITLLHYESVFNLNAPSFEQIKGINCYDVKHFRTRDFGKIFELLNIDIVVVMHVTFPLDKIAIEKAHEKQIPIIFVQTAAISDEVSEKVVFIKKVNKNKIFRYLKYVKLTADNKLLNTNMIRFYFKIFKDSKKVFYSPDFTLVSSCDYYIVNSKYDLENYYLKYYCGDRNKYRVLGCYETAFARRKYRFVEDVTKKNTIIYIDQPLVEDNLISQNTFEKFLSKLVQQLYQRDYKLIVCLHPRSVRSKYNSFKKEIRIVREKTTEFLSNAGIVLGHFSTALYQALEMGKKVIIYQFDNLALTNINKAASKVFKNLDELYLDEVEPTQSEKVNYYIGNSEAYFKKFYELIKGLL